MKRLFLITAILGCIFSGCKKDHDHDHPFFDLGIPYGQLPPPGECKIWIPGLESGQQGSPQSCESAMLDAPLGAWVISRTENRYEVNVLSDSNPHIVVEVRYYGLP
jgi:hypothetical protein